MWLRAPFPYVFGANGGEAHLNAADGREARARPGEAFISGQQAEVFRHSGPPRPLHQRRLRDFFLMSRPPLLFQEGSGAPTYPG
jgi:hypothetical protein